MSFHSYSTNTTNKEEEENKNNGLSQSIQVVSEILKKRSEKPRKSWFLYEKQKKDLEKQIDEFHINNFSKSDMEIKQEKNQMEIEEEPKNNE